MGVFAQIYRTLTILLDNQGFCVKRLQKYQ